MFIVLSHSSCLQWSESWIHFELPLTGVSEVCKKFTFEFLCVPHLQPQVFQQEQTSLTRWTLLLHILPVWPETAASSLCFWLVRVQKSAGRHLSWMLIGSTSSGAPDQKQKVKRHWKKQTFRIDHQMKQHVYLPAGVQLSAPAPGDEFRYRHPAGNSSFLSSGFPLHSENHRGFSAAPGFSAALDLMLKSDVEIFEQVLIVIWSTSFLCLF